MSSSALIRTLAIAGSLASALALGCGGEDEPGVDDTADIGAADATDATTTDGGPTSDAATDAGDAGEGDDAGGDDAAIAAPACAESATGTWIITRFEFLATNPDGTVDGYDVDGVVSDGSDAEGCAKVDATSSDGTEGIDNQLAVLLPALEATGVSLQTLIGARIKEGQIVFVTELDGTYDDCDAVRFQRGDGEVLFGSDGSTLAYQTLGLYEGATESTSTTCESTSECGVRVTGEQLTLEFLFITQEIRIDLFEWQGDFEVGDDGTLTGLIGGAVGLDGVMDIVEGLGGCGDEPIRQALEPLLPNFADVFPDEDGQCTGISVAVRIEAVPIYLFED